MLRENVNGIINKERLSRKFMSTLDLNNFYQPVFNGESSFLSLSLLSGDLPGPIELKINKRTNKFTRLINFWNNEIFVYSKNNKLHFAAGLLHCNNSCSDIFCTTQVGIHLPEKVHHCAKIKWLFIKSELYF